MKMFRDRVPAEVKRYYHGVRRRLGLAAPPSGRTDFAGGGDADANRPGNAFSVVAHPKDGFLTRDFFLSLKTRPDTIIDVGVSRGTPWLYRSFPSTRFLLVDPLPGFEKTLIKPPRTYECLNLGLGAEPGEMELDLRGPRSSLHKWSEKTKAPSEGKVKVRIGTLDDLISTHVPEGSIGLKIDTEGHEIEVIRGLDKHRDRVEFIISECSIRRRFSDDYRFSELIAEYAAKGFEFYNFLSMQQVRPVHYDCIFLKSGDRRFGLGAI